MREFIITALTTLLLIQVSANLDNKGHLFMLSFMEPSQSDGKIYLSITAENITHVKVLEPNLNQVYEQNLTAGQTWLVPLPSEVRYTNWFQNVKQGVMVTSAPSKVTVMAADVGEFAASGYMALPFQTLSDSYIAVIVDDTDSGNDPVFLILGLDNSTTVTVFYKIQNSGNCAGYGTGDNSTHTLDKQDVFGIQCSDDFTGTFIQSDKPIAVICGHPELTLYTGSAGRDAVQEMLLPIKHYGQSYVLFSHRAWNRGSVNRVVAAYDDTRVNSSTGDVVDLNAQEFITIDTDLNGQLCLTSSRPVQVVSFAKSYAMATSIGDTIMSILLPTHTFADNVHVNFGLADSIGQNEYITVTIIADRRTVPPGPVAPQVIHEEINGCIFDTYTQPLFWPLSDSVGGFRFGAYVYGTYGYKYSGIGFPVIMDLDGEGCLLPCVNGVCTWNHTEYICVCEEPYFGLQCTDQVVLNTTDSYQDSIDGSQDDLSTALLTPSVDEISHRSSETVVTQSQQTPVQLTVQNSMSLSVDRWYLVDQNYYDHSDSDSSGQFTLPPLSQSGNSQSLFQIQILPASSHESALPTFVVPDRASVSFLTSTEVMSSALSLPTSSNLAVQTTQATDAGYVEIYPSTHSKIQTLQTKEATTEILSSQLSQKIVSSARLPSIPLSYASQDHVTILPQSVIPHEGTSSSFFEIISRAPATSPSISNALLLSPSGSSVTPETPETSDGCGCVCYEKPGELDEKAIMEIKRRIRKKLLMERRNLSSAIRKRTSATDDRPSAVGVGYLGIFIMSLVVSLIFLPDVFNFLKDGVYGPSRGRYQPRNCRRLRSF